MDNIIVSRTEEFIPKIIGMEMGIAKSLLDKHEIHLREIQKDGVGQMITLDWRANRINIKTKNGVIIAADVG
jgi:hypothetical protein